MELRGPVRIESWEAALRLHNAEGAFSKGG